MDKINVFLADWQVLFREGIHFTLSGEEDMEVIGEDSSNEPALAFIETNLPQVAILNANHEKLSGIEATRHLKQNLPEVSVILIMDSDNEEELFAVMKSGANACLTKDVDPEIIIDTVRKVAQGGQIISDSFLKPEIASRALDQFESFSATGEQVSKLLAHPTPRETEILHHLANGSSKEQLSQTLGINEDTISHKLQSILHKLVANEQKQMLIEAIQNGLPSTARISFNGKPGAEYITKEEFNAFKEGLKERFKSLSGEIS